MKKLHKDIDYFYQEQKKTTIFAKKYLNQK